MMAATYPSLQGRLALVTGGGSGIGAAIVERLCAQGVRVAFIDVDDAASLRLVAQLAGQAFYRRCDLTDTGALLATVASLVQEHGPVTVLVNNAARDDRHAFDAVTSESWDQALAVNLKHQFFATQAVVPAMAEAGGGSVIMMGSISWMRGREGMVCYTTSKAAINGLTRTLARELGPRSIRVNCVVPGAIVTERQRRLWRTPEESARFLELQCLKFELGPDEVASMALFLASDESRGCTGQNFVVDAGIV